MSELELVRARPNFLEIMLRSCHEVHRLVAEGFDHRHGPWTRFRIRLHLLACDACTNFKHDLNLLRQAMRRLDQS